jgi:hypothetical protein
LYGKIGGRLCKPRFAGSELAGTSEAGGVYGCGVGATAGGGVNALGGAGAGAGADTGAGGVYGLDGAGAGGDDAGGAAGSGKEADDCPSALRAPSSATRLSAHAPSFDAPPPVR